MRVASIYSLSRCGTTRVSPEDRIVSIDMSGFGCITLASLASAVPLRAKVPGMSICETGFGSSPPQAALRAAWADAELLRLDLMNSRRSALIVSASVVGMPCGKPL